VTKKSVRKRTTKKKAGTVKHQTRNTGAKKVGPAPKPKRQKPETGLVFKPKPKPKKATTKRAQRHQRRG